MTDEIDISTLPDDQLAAMMGDEPPPAEVEEGPEPAAPEAPPEPPKPETQHVPLADLMEERGRRKEAQARMEEMERRFSEFQQRVAEHFQQQPQQPAVDYDQDPIEYLRQQQAAVAQNLESLRAQQQAIVQRQQAEQQWTAMRTAVGEAEKQFAERQPDYWEAVKYLRESRASDLAQQGMPPQQVAQVIAQDAMAVTAEAGRLALSPAEYAYRIALGKGYTPKARQVAQAAAAAEEAPKSLGGASGKPDGATPSLSDISRMGDKEFERVFQKLMAGT